MNKLLAIVLLINVAIGCGHSDVNKQKIADFKNDFIDEVEMYKPDTLRIDTLILIREKFPNVRLIKTFTKNRNVVLYEYYYNGTARLESTYCYDTLKRIIGKSKHFTEKGELKYTKDYDNGEWFVPNKYVYPFYDLQSKMKVTADSLISKMYGHSFLINNVVWNIDGSYISNQTESGYWTDRFKKTPTEFLFRYDVKLDKNNRFDELIEFALDSNGVFIPNQYEAIYGFENVADNLKGSFKLTYDQAIIKAKELGLTENDTTKAVGILRWENFDKPKLINGRFRFYVTIRTKIIESIVPNGRSRRISKYDVYSFNPWTGEFIEKKKMKSIYSWEKLSGNSTGLIPDKE